MIHKNPKHAFASREVDIEVTGCADIRPSNVIEASFLPLKALTNSEEYITAQFAYYGCNLRVEALQMILQNTKY